MRTIIRSHKLDAELTDIFEYLGRDSIELAIRFVEAAEQSFLQLAAQPDLGTTGE